ncbi:MAG: DUF4327 family protein [Spirirestis rafaelensis WJT71-NPBG6]|jgi:hypothetical protein|nr:DUF4327 family protein [Spirirestis rafaelensis WJT71-NPBG6]
MTQHTKYDFKFLLDKVSYLVEEGFIGRAQPIYALALYMNFCQWALVEKELKERNLQIGDRISNLIDTEK